MRIGHFVIIGQIDQRESPGTIESVATLIVAD